MVNIFSKKTAISILDQVNKDHARAINEMKVNIEVMYSKGLTTREMKAKGYGGHSLFSDNVGKVINPRYL